jgi:hypothetical protein
VSEVRKLGRFSFVLQGADKELTDQLSALFPQSGEDNGAPNIVQLTDGDVRTVVNQALRYHDGCLWIDAAALISPNGKKVLIAGASHSGKSTSTVALALIRNWKVLSEDITLFDPLTDKLLSFASPFSLKPGTADRLRANACIPPRLFMNEWISMEGMMAEGEQSPQLDLAFAFRHLADPSAPGSLELGELSPTEFVHCLLPISNLLHVNGLADKMVSYLSRSRCFALGGGSITERLDLIESLTRA